MVVPNCLAAHTAIGKMNGFFQTRKSWKSEEEKHPLIQNLMALAKLAKSVMEMPENRGQGIGRFLRKQDMIKEIW